jgi:hypothetical protein
LEKRRRLTINYFATQADRLSLRDRNGDAASFHKMR